MDVRNWLYFLALSRDSMFIETPTRNLADRVATLCLEKFDSLPSKGKPITGQEWTLLSGVVQSSVEDSVDRMKVVSLASGTKCIGSNKLCASGTVINDSHAEVGYN